MADRSNRFLRLKSTILDSSLCDEDPATRWLWLTMLILADEAGTGVVDLPISKLASRASLTLEQTAVGLEILSSPDPESRSQLEGGRRIMPLVRAADMAPRGWKLVNWGQMRDDAEREWAAERQRRHRAVTDGHSVSHAVTPDQTIPDQTKPEQEKMQATLPGVPVPAPLDLVGVSPPKVREPKPKGTRAPKPPVYLNPPSIAEVEEFVRLRYPKANAKDFAFRFVRKQTEIEWRDKQGRPLRNWKATVDNWMDFEELKEVRR